MQNKSTPNLSVCQLILSKIKKLLASDEFLDAHRLPNRFVRSRKLSMRQVIYYLFFSSKQAMPLNISEIRADIPEIQFPDVCKQAVSKARQGILPSLFKAFFDLSVDCFYANIPKLKYWRDKYRIFAIDGSKLNLPNSKSNFENFGEMFSFKNHSRRWTMATCSTVYDVCNDYIVHGLLRHFLASERTAALEHCKVLNNLNLFDNAILIFDRGYYSEKMYRYFADHGRLCLMRIKDCLNLAKDCTGDNIMTIPGSRKNKTEDVRVRVIRIELDGGTTEYLVTNIFDDLSDDDFKELYFLRWPIELKYNELKNKCLLEEFSGATSTSVEQDFYITLLLSNLSALIKADADEKIQDKARTTNKFRYQSNRSYILGSLKSRITRIIAGIADVSVLLNLLESACRVKSQIQPGRKCPRNHRAKYKERNHFNNRKQVL